MRRKGLPAAAVVIVAVGLAIAGATARPAPSADLSAAVPTALSPALQNLITTGVWPTDVTAEPGVWNYAGASCPGPGWNCVSLGVFEITQAGTVSVVECVAATCPPITQTADVNVAKCEQKVQTTAAFVPQRCIVTQTGQDNQATIVQVIGQTGSASQGALQEAWVRQTATGSKNQLQVDQEINQFTNVGTTQHQDAYQVVTGRPSTFERPPARQTAVGAGDNQAQIDQKQIQRAKGGTTTTTQTQNDGVTAPLFTKPPDCHPLDNPPDPHACTNLEQSSGMGDNQSQLSQNIDEEATTAGVATPQATVTQQQGVTPVDTNPDPNIDFFLFPGGVDGRLHQETTAPGSSQPQANQNKTQNASAPPGSTQRQFDPGGCCGFGSIIGPGQGELAQVGDQHASENAALQTIMLHGVFNGTFESNCAIAQAGQNNSGDSSGSFTADPCFFLVVETICTNPPPPSEDGPTEACITEEVGD